MYSDPKAYNGQKNLTKKIVNQKKKKKIVKKTQVK